MESFRELYKWRGIDEERAGECVRGWNKGMRNRVERYVMIECGILRERDTYW